MQRGTSDKIDYDVTEQQDKTPEGERMKKRLLSSITGSRTYPLFFLLFYCFTQTSLVFHLQKLQLPFTVIGTVRKMYN